MNVPHDSGRDRNDEIAEDRVEVCSVVVSFAKRPFRAAKAPEERARTSHFEWAGDKALGLGCWGGIVAAVSVEDR